MNKPLVQVKNLSVALKDSPGTMILNNISLNVSEGEILGFAGGSGSGKTTLGLALLGLVSPAMAVTSGDVVVHGEEVFSMKPERLRQLRGGKVAMIFQEPLSAFDPVYTVGYQIAETLEAHGICSGQQATARAHEWLSRCGIPDPKRVALSYPHQLSGGLRQRAMIAQALCAGPSVLVADEPTSSLDVTVQAGIMDLFRTLRKDLGLSMVLISHDLGLLRHLADDVVVLCGGRVVEQGSAAALSGGAKHPYTQALLAAENI